MNMTIKDLIKKSILETLGNSPKTAPVTIPKPTTEPKSPPKRRTLQPPQTAPETKPKAEGKVNDVFKKGDKVSSENETLEFIKYNDNKETFTGKRIKSKFKDDKIGSIVPDAYVSRYHKTPVSEINSAGLDKIVKRFKSLNQPQKQLDEGILKKILPGLCAVGALAMTASCNKYSVKYSYIPNKFDKQTNQPLEKRDEFNGSTFLAFDHKLDSAELENIRKKMDQQYNERFASETQDKSWERRVDTSWIESYVWSKDKDYR